MDPKQSSWLPRMRINNTCLDTTDSSTTPFYSLTPLKLRRIVLQETATLSAHTSSAAQNNDSDCVLSEIHTYLRTLIQFTSELGERLIDNADVRGSINGDQSRSNYLDLRRIKEQHYRETDIRGLVRSLREIVKNATPACANGPMISTPSAVDSVAVAGAASERRPHPLLAPPVPYITPVNGKACPISLMVEVNGPRLKSPVPVKAASPSEVADPQKFDIPKELLSRGKGAHICPYGEKCDKGGRNSDGSTVVFERNSAFKTHWNKHSKPYRCDYQGCTNLGFARNDQLQRHQKNVHSGRAGKRLKGNR